MHLETYVQKRKGRYMAQTLEDFERLIEPLIPKEVANEFKGTVRRKMNALAVDVVEVFPPDTPIEINGYAREMRDKIATAR